jgi:hypothetical protein
MSLVLCCRTCVCAKHFYGSKCKQDIDGTLPCSGVAVGSLLSSLQVISNIFDKSRLGKDATYKNGSSEQLLVLNFSTKESEEVGIIDGHRLSSRPLTQNLAAESNVNGRRCLA